MIAERKIANIPEKQSLIDVEIKNTLRALSDSIALAQETGKPESVITELFSSVLNRELKEAREDTQITKDNLIFDRRSRALGRKRTRNLGTQLLHHGH